MATIINTGSGAKVTMLASLTSVPTSITAISGTENWKKYDAIYFECVMHYKDAKSKAIFTNLILTNNISIGDRYQPIRVSGADGSSSEANIFCYFSENVLSAYKIDGNYGITKLNIYGVDF